MTMTFIDRLAAQRWKRRMEGATGRSWEQTVGAAKEAYRIDIREIFEDAREAVTEEVLGAMGDQDHWLCDEDRHATDTHQRMRGLWQAAIDAAMEGR